MNAFFPKIRALTGLAVTAAVVVLAAPAAPAAGQQPTPQQVELLRNNPQMVRERIQQSGLSEAQIRERLQQAGYNPGLLDPYLTGRQACRTAAK